MRPFFAFGLALVLSTGCGSLPARPSDPSQMSMTRNFHGHRVAGYSVSPTAYEHYIRAQLLANDGRSELAIDELHHAIAMDGSSAYLRTRIAEELLNLGRVDEAREEVEMALRLDEALAEAHVDLARVFLRLRNRAGAEAELEHSLAIEPSCEDAYLMLVALYRERNEGPRLIDLWTRMFKYVPDSAQAPLQLGRAALSAGNDRAAETYFRRALELNATLSEARVGLGDTLDRLGRPYEALTYYEDQFRRSGDMKVADRFVHVAVSLGELDRAQALIDRLEEDGGSSERRIGIGWLNIAAKRPDRARRLGLALLERGESSHARLLVGAALAGQGQLDAAMTELQKIPVGSSQFVRALMQLAELYLKRDDRVRAIETYRNALAQHPDEQTRHSIEQRMMLLENGRIGSR